MAALKFFARSIITFNNNLHCYSLTKQLFPLTANQISKRWASFKSSPQYNENTNYTNFEVTKNPEEWKWVEHYLPSTRVPDPPKNITKPLASGWKPAKEKAKQLPYFIARTRNHMQPVYFVRRQRGMRRLTVLRRISGDIIALEADLRKYLEEVTGKEIGTQLIEPSGVIKFRGDYASRIKDWMELKGF
ncbi:hypothetical protein G9C98_004965 [Cotesia typhae]|uniref:Large ribosomal subunit protein mL49 n=1 Tax=Cotesia typhae TaxID=2053667 RepID=A0A8J5V1L6_9HYME|nr:hypothetical protein G9C98_004965 [Cotesia typhae]